MSLPHGHIGRGIALRYQSTRAWVRAYAKTALPHALHDDPGIPGDPGWQLLSKNGSRGPAGEVGPRGRKGERGARGEDASEITGWHIERATFRAFPVYGDGRMGPELNLRGLFEQYQLETT